MKKQLRTFLAFAAVTAGAVTAFAGPYRYDALAEGLLIKDSSGHIYESASVGPLPRYTDSEQTDRQTSVSGSNIFSAASLYAHAESFEGKVRSVAKATKVHVLPLLTAGPDLLSADSIKSVSSDTATGDGKGTSEFSNLRLLGNLFVPSGEVDEKVVINVDGIGKVGFVFNSETVFDDGHISHVAVRVILPDGRNVFICRATAGAAPKTTTP